MPEERQIINDIYGVDDLEVMENIADAVNQRIKELRRRHDRQIIRTLRPGDRVKVTGRLRNDAFLGEEGEVAEVKKTRVAVRFAVNDRGVPLPGDYHPAVLIPASVLTKVE